MNTLEKGFYCEKKREIPIIGEYDVIVAGGGPAGCAAALAAAGYGADVLLIENEGFLGGAPATQFVTSILSTNGVDFQGIWHEWIHKLRSLNGVHGLNHISKPLAGYVLGGKADPEAVKYAWDELLEAGGVKVLHYCLVADAIVSENTIAGLVIESVAGRQAIFGKRVIDCTGDGTVCFHAGVGWEHGNGKDNYGMACNFRFYMGNICAREQEASPKQFREVQAKIEREIDKYSLLDGSISAEELMGYSNSGSKRVIGPGKFLYKVDPLKPADLTRAVREGRKYAWEFMQLLNECVEDRRDAFVSSTPNRLGVRTSRRIRGLETVTHADVWEFKKYDDGIAKGSWDIDIYNPYEYEGFSVARHTPEYQLRIEKMKQGDYYDIRYKALVAKGVNNLLMAGRCISSEHEAQASLRIQQTCISTGQAAGTAAAMSVLDKVTPEDVDIEKLKMNLERDRDVEPGFSCLKREL